MLEMLNDHWQGPRFLPETLIGLINLIDVNDLIGFTLQHLFAMIVWPQLRVKVFGAFAEYCWGERRWRRIDSLTLEGVRAENPFSEDPSDPLNRIRSGTTLPSPPFQTHFSQCQTCLQSSRISDRINISVLAYLLSLPLLNMKSTSYMYKAFYFVNYYVFAFFCTADFKAG